METFPVVGEQHDHQAARRHAHGLHTVAGVPDTKQFAVRVHVELGRRHVPSHVSAENIHHRRVFGAHIETETVETPVGRAGRAHFGRRPRPAQRLRRQDQ